MRMIPSYPKELTVSAENFAKTIEEWFGLLKSLPDKPWGIDEICQLTPGLARLCMLAYQLPVTDYRMDEDTDKERYDREFISIRIDFDEEFRHYFTLFFPYEGIRNGHENKDIPVMSDLVDDMYDICNDLQDGLGFYKKGMIYRAVRLWRDLFLSHWGEHASQALYAMDHAMRGYLWDDDLGKHDVPFDFTYYPPARYMDIDGFFILSISPKDSSLPYELIIDTLGLAEDDNPMVGVVVGDMVIYVSVSENPENLSRTEFPDQDRVFKWIIQHRELLEDHWYKEITDRELLESLNNEVISIFPPDRG